MYILKKEIPKLFKKELSDNFWDFYYIFQPILFRSNDMYLHYCEYLMLVRCTGKDCSDCKDERCKNTVLHTISNADVEMNA